MTAKKALLIFPSLALLLVLMTSSRDCITKDGYFRGKKLAGKVKVVDHYADFKVKVVNSYPDLKVKVKERYASSPGEWQFVDNYPDFTIQFVSGYPDFTIKYVSSYPGVTNPCKVKK